MRFKEELLQELEKECEKDQALIKKSHAFYYPKIDKNGLLSDITIDRVKLLNLLMDNGFYRLDLGVDSYCFVRVVDKKVKQVSITFITDWWFSYLKHLEPYTWLTGRLDGDGEEIEVTVYKDYIQNKFLRSISSYFSENLLSRLQSEKEIQFMEDTKYSKYLFYQNGYVTINKKGHFFNDDYSKLEHHVWEDQILSRSYNTRCKEYELSDFFHFCYNVSGKNMKRFDSLQTIIGYTLHHFREYKLKATILTDAQMSTEGEANGRTGKGIFVNALGHMLNNKENDDAKVYCQINGKGFDFTEKHRYQKADINTKLVHLEDVKAYFVIDNLFNDITEGVEVDKKNEKPFTIYPKFVLSTNKTIKINGGSAKDRVIQFEFAEHYSKDYSPEQEFGRWLFTEWDEIEWNRFDSFMINCVYQFFKNDLEIKEPESINLKQRTLIDHTSQEFVNYMDFFKFTDNDHKNGTVKGFYIVPEGQDLYEYNKKELYNEFIEAYPHFQKRRGFSQSKFTNWMRQYSESSDILKTINPKMDERRSNNVDYIVFRKQ